MAKRDNTTATRTAPAATLAPMNDAVIGDPSAAERAAREAGGEKLYEVAIPKGYTAKFWARTPSEAKDKYVAYFGVIATEHKMRVDEATDDDAPAAAPARKGDDFNPDANPGDDE